MFQEDQLFSCSYKLDAPALCTLIQIPGPDTTPAELIEHDKL